jgi:hypothetical protein
VVSVSSFAPGAGFDRGRLWLRSSHGQVALALLVYFVVDIAYFGTSVLPDLSGTCACRAGADPTVYMWFLSWWPHALLHGNNPFFTDALFAPGRINLGAIDLVPGAAILAAPITLLFGPLVSYNVLALSTPVLAAFFAFLLCRYVSGSVVAALVGGYIFGFSPYMLGHMQGHLDLLLTFPIPAAVHLTLRLMDERVGRRTFVPMMTLLLAFLFLSQPELTAMFVMLGAGAFALSLLLVPSERRRIARAIPPVLVAGTAAGLLTSVFIYYSFRGDITNGFFAGFGDTYVADALGFVTPTPVIRLGRSWFSTVAASFTGGTPENGVYVGLVIALVVVRYAITRWGRPATRVLITMLALVVVLMLGAHLHIDGHPTVPLPWGWIGRLPLLVKMAPVRMAVYMFLIVAVIVAMWLGQARSGRLGAAKWVVAAVAVATLVPNLSSSLWHTRLDNPSFFTDSTYRSVLGSGETVLPVPFAIWGESMLWQAETGFRFRMADGYLGALVPSWYARDLGVPPLSAIKPDPAALRDFLADRRVSTVVVDAADPLLWPQALAAIGFRPRLVGGVFVYHVPDASVDRGSAVAPAPNADRQ